MKQRLSPPELSHENTYPEAICIGGTGAPKAAYPVYAPLLNSGHPAEIPGYDRYLPIPDLGFRDPDATLDKLRDKVDRISANLDTRPIIVGHSHGAHYAIRLGLEGRASAVVSAAGVNRPMSERNLTAMFFKSIGRDALIRYFKAGSPAMEMHQEQMETEWPDDVPLHVVAPTVDQVIYHKYQYGLHLPNNSQQLHEWYNVPGCKIASQALRMVIQTPQNVKPLKNRSILPTEHVSVIWSSGIRNLVKKLQEHTALDNSVSLIS
jgi:hypothetical protein